MKHYILIILLFPYCLVAQFGDKLQRPISIEQDIKASNDIAQQITVDTSKINYWLSVEETTYVCAVAIPTKLSFQDFQLKSVLDNGDKLYQLTIQSKNALGMMMYFEHLDLPKGSKLWVFNPSTLDYVGAYTDKDKYNTGHFLTSTVVGDKLTIEYLEPKNINSPNIVLTKVFHYFRGLKSSDGFRTSENCMLNAACSEGVGFEDAKNATCRILIVGSQNGGFTGYCSGTLVNNTLQDKTPYILTANHCSNQSVLADLVDWEFHFYYQSTTCTTPSFEPNYLILKGSQAMAYTGSDGGEYSSDFLLLKLTSSLPISYPFTFAGWDRSAIQTSGGVCFHHPDGDIKKVSTYSPSPIVSSYKNKVQGTHYAVFWKRTTNGYSVTQGGSSGSGLFNSQGLLIGTLTGGQASCTDQNLQDLYGRFYFHWDQNGNAASLRLKDWLDPNSSGVASLNSTAKSASINNFVDKDKEMSFAIAKSTLTVFWDMPKYLVNIYDMYGKNIATVSSLNGATSYDMSGLPRAIYIVEATNASSRKVLKIKW